MTSRATGSYNPSRATQLCEETYIPTEAEFNDPDFLTDEGNDFLIMGRSNKDVIIDDTRLRDSWAVRSVPYFSLSKLETIH